MNDGARSLEIARRMVELGRAEDAARAYALALQSGIEEDPAAELEAAVCVLQFGKDYRLSYRTLHRLHGRGLFREETFAIMTGAFYEPNVRDQQSHYERNCKRLKKYPYLFRTDFIPFEDLPIQFYPYDDSSYFPYYPAEGRFGELIDFKEPVIRHYFFKNLENPILAEDIFSQYELEYLNDNVRKSEHVAKENHIYLHYTCWTVFCAYLQCWNLNPLLEDEKFVFLIENEASQYPIDFKARFGIDYSQYPVKPIAIREVNRLIWHTQLSTHNGGDFFNEVFDSHPNLIILPSMMLEKIENLIAAFRRELDCIKSSQDALHVVGGWDPLRVQELYLMKGRTEKDIIVALFLTDKRSTLGIDPTARIAPALFFQPHFGNIFYDVEFDAQRRAVLHSKQYEKISQSSIFRNFKYIKTFTPMRRITTSYAASIRFVISKDVDMDENGIPTVVGDAVFERIMNRSYLRDPEDRLLKDSRLVRFEDGKLNPKATFKALAEFLDLPYTESMTYCSEFGALDPHPETKGFDPAPVYRTYDQCANDAERTLIEYFMRDAYERYGYDFHYYDGSGMDEARFQKLSSGCTIIQDIMVETYRNAIRALERRQNPDMPEEQLEAVTENQLRLEMQSCLNKRVDAAHILMEGLRFLNVKGQPLVFMTKLEPDPALLVQPLYH